MLYQTNSTNNSVLHFLQPIDIKTFEIPPNLKVHGLPKIILPKLPFPRLKN